MRFVAAVLLYALPLFAHGAITISEIAWMGDEASPNNEWIELHNTGTVAVSVDGYVLRGSTDLEIPLLGTIGAGAYAVLERTDDTAAPGKALLFYTGALSNSGTMLSLYRPDGSLEDRVAGGENWENIGGDNESKETAQYTKSGWSTAEATPGEAPPEVTEEKPDEDEEEEGEKKDDDGEKNETVELQLPDGVLQLELIIPEKIYVNQEATFEAVPSGLGDTLLDSLHYQWNFGDLNTAMGRTVSHVYTNAGEYMVTVYAAFARHELTVRKQVSVLPVTFSLARNDKGDVLLQNKARYEVNISGYMLQGLSKIVFPAGSIIIGSGTIVIPQEKLGEYARARVALYDAEGKLVAFEGMEEDEEKAQRKPLASAALSVSAPTIITASSPDTDTSNFSFADDQNSFPTASAQEMSTTSPQEQAAAAISSDTPKKDPIPQEALPFLGLAGIIIVGILAVFAGRKS